MCTKLYDYVLSILAEIGKVSFWSKRPKGLTRVWDPTSTLRWYSCIQLPFQEYLFKPTLSWLFKDRYVLIPSLTKIRSTKILYLLVIDIKKKMLWYGLNFRRYLISLFFPDVKNYIKTNKYKIIKTWIYYVKCIYRF